MDEAKIREILAKEIELLASHWRFELLKSIDFAYDNEVSTYYDQLLDYINSLDKILRVEYFAQDQEINLNPQLEITYENKLRAFRIPLNVDKAKKLFVESYYKFKLYKYDLLQRLLIILKTDFLMYAYKNASQFKQTIKTIFEATFSVSDLLQNQYLALSYIMQKIQKASSELISSSLQYRNLHSSVTKTQEELGIALRRMNTTLRRFQIETTLLWAKLINFEQQKWVRINGRIHKDFVKNMLRIYVQGMKNTLNKI